MSLVVIVLLPLFRRCYAVGRGDHGAITWRGFLDYSIALGSCYCCTSRAQNFLEKSPLVVLACKYTSPRFVYLYAQGPFFWYHWCNVCFFVVVVLPYLVSVCEMTEALCSHDPVSCARCMVDAYSLRILAARTTSTSTTRSIIGGK